MLSSKKLRVDLYAGGAYIKEIQYVYVYAIKSLGVLFFYVNGICRFPLVLLNVKKVWPLLQNHTHTHICYRIQGGFKRELRKSRP